MRWSDLSRKHQIGVIVSLSVVIGAIFLGAIIRMIPGLIAAYYIYQNPPIFYEGTVIDLYVYYFGVYLLVVGFIILAFGPMVVIIHHFLKSRLKSSFLGAYEKKYDKD